VVAHLHYVLFGGSVFGVMAGFYFWFPKMTGRMLSETVGKIQFVLMFVGFNLTFFPQFLLGLQGMPRRYHAYPAEWQVLNVLSSAGASVLGVGLILPVGYFLYSLRYGKVAGPNPWGARGLEWETTSPPPTFNFDEQPVVEHEAYDYPLPAGKPGAGAAPASAH